jgi:hypothetical protein
VAVAAAVLATVGLTGVALGAAGAGPDSPLWPVTRAVYPDRADSRMHQAAAQRDLDDAQQAVAAGDTTDARRYLDDAGHHLSRVKASAEATKLRQRADRMRRKLDAANAASAASTATGAPPTPSASGSAATRKGNGKSKSTPSPSGQPDGTDASLDAATVAPPPGESATPSASPTPKKVKPSKTKKAK